MRLLRECRGWVRQQSLRKLALAYRNSGAILRSASTALTLYRDYPQTNQLDALPLCWGVGDVPTPSKATRWIENQRPTAQLLGAKRAVVDREVITRHADSNEASVARRAFDGIK